MFKRVNLSRIKAAKPYLKKSSNLNCNAKYLNQQGMSFLELLISLVLFSVGLLAVAQLNTANTRLAYEGLNYAAAHITLNSVLERGSILSQQEIDALLEWNLPGAEAEASAGLEPESLVLLWNSLDVSLHGKSRISYSW